MKWWLELCPEWAAVSRVLFTNRIVDPIHVVLSISIHEKVAYFSLRNDVGFG